MAAVIFGATVTVLNLDNDEEQTWRIVGDDEADFKQNLISELAYRSWPYR
jgi:transcription elongation factor GreA